MSINKHNYEEYFILYLDNELSAEDIVLVETFLAANPELKEEMEMLREVILTPDAVSFDAKDDLFKNEKVSPVAASNFSEWAVLAMDKELNKGDIGIFDAFLDRHPEFIAEYQQLQQTKLLPETVIFSEKESLYRREKRSQVISLFSWRNAAAAAVLLLVGVGVWNRMQRATDVLPQHSGLASIDSADKHEGSKALLAQTQPEVAEIPVVENQQKEQYTDNHHTPQPSQLQPGTVAYASGTNRTTAVINSNGVQEGNRESKENTPQIPLERVAPVTAITPVGTSIPDSEKVIVQQIENNIQAPVGFVHNNKQKDADMVYLNTEGDASVSEKKSRGFFRKLTRNISKRANIGMPEEDSKVYIGIFAVNL